MLNGRIYRAAGLPLLIALLVAAFSLGDRPAALSTTPAPAAFEGSWAAQTLASLARQFPDRKPGSEGDDALARRVAHIIESLGGPSSGGFQVSSRRFEGRTIDGRRTLSTVIAQRPGDTDSSAIVIVAHRDATARGSEAELSGTAVLLELARVFASRETHRTIILVSTSGGSAGNAGAANLAAHLGVPVDGVIVLGDLAGTTARKPFVVAWSRVLGSPPDQLVRTLDGALAQQLDTAPGAPGVIDQFAHLAFPFTLGEQGALNAAGLPAVLVQVSGERGPSPHEAISSTRIEDFGSAILGAIDALDSGPDISRGPQGIMLTARKVIPAWAIRLLVGALMLPALLVGIDALVRAWRRHEPVGRWAKWTLACALPFLACALFAIVLGRLGIIAAPGAPLPASSMAMSGSALAAVILVFVLACLLLPGLLGRLRGQASLDLQQTGVSVLLVLDVLALLIWIINPFTALLLVPALHLWLLLVERLPGALRPGRGLALAVILLGLVLPALVVLFYAHQLALGPAGVAWTGILLLASGQVGVLTALLWSLFFGCAVAAVLVALRGGVDFSDPPPVTIRGPISYAGPGSLGGTSPYPRR